MSYTSTTGSYIALSPGSLSFQCNIKRLREPGNEASSYMHTIHKVTMCKDQRFICYNQLRKLTTLATFDGGSVGWWLEIKLHVSFHMHSQQPVHCKNECSTLRVQSNSHQHNHQGEESSLRNTSCPYTGQGRCDATIIVCVCVCVVILGKGWEWRLSAVFTVEAIYSSKWKYTFVHLHKNIVQSPLIWS